MSEATWVTERFRYRRAATAVEPAATLTSKDGLAWRVLWWLGAVLTLGVLPALLPLRRFLEDFATAVGPWVGIPRRWPSVTPRLLRHECRHATQFTWFGWLTPVLGWCFGRRVRAAAGVLPLGVAYALLPLPIGLALGRYWLEADAEVAAWRGGLADGTLPPADVRARATEFGRLLAGPSYGFAWPWAVRCLRRRAEREVARWEKVTP